MVWIHSTSNINGVLIMNTFMHPISGYVHTQYTVILSAHLTHSISNSAAPTPDELNYAYHKSLGIELMNIIGTNPMLVEECTGHYDDIVERSYIVHCHDIGEVFQLNALSHNYNQQCILVVDHRSESAMLMFRDGQLSRIGKNLEQCQAQAYKGDYTLIGGKCYVVQ